MSRDDVIEDVKRVAALYNKPTITAREYTKYGKYSSSAVVRHIGSWNENLLQAEMPINENRNFTDEELFEEIERIWIMLGRQPTTTDIKKGKCNNFALLYEITIIPSSVFISDAF